MLTEIYIEALLADESLADQVWEAWDAGLIPDEAPAKMSCLLFAIALVVGDWQSILLRPVRHSFTVLIDNNLVK